MEMLQKGIQIQELTTVSRSLEIRKSAQSLKTVAAYEGPMNKFVLPESLSNHKETVVAEANQLGAEYRLLDISQEPFKYEIDLNASAPSNVLAQATSLELNVKATSHIFE